MHFDNKAITFFGVAFQQLYLYIPFVTLLVNYVSILLPQCITLCAIHKSKVESLKVKSSANSYLLLTL